MANHRLWCWEAAQLGSGPDWIFVARVAPECAGELAALLERAAPAGFSPCPARDEYCPDHERVCRYHSLIDTSNLAAYTGNLAGQAAQNIWVYNMIQAHGDTLEYNSGYGGRGEEASRAETALLLALLATPGISLRSWKVIAGGDGYDYRTLRGGDDAASLLAYLG